MTSNETQQDRADEPPEDEPGAEGGSGASETKAPFAAHEDDDSALGDTDQHSDA